jgi:hypothetical protein
VTFLLAGQGMTRKLNAQNQKCYSVICASKRMCGAVG